ncbi:DUF6475 domain-containing protein [Herminiimonas sp. CN]|uniref:DUF6475 domain-containing protein n=1 Tax=Herminiimonas sp. CN TaxID=1349818 RepID=UPI00047384E3|nr:DUF6475 domain-containing protein [Herminiimonas sp. CN]
MKQSDFDHFSNMLNAVGDLYGKTPSEWAIGIWWNALQQYDLPAVREALNRHVKNPDNGQYMPKPADVVRMIQGTTTDSALHAWAKVDKAVRQVGTYRDVVFDDAIIHRVMHDMGGWVGFGTKSEDEWPFVAREFENRYRGYKARNEVPEYQPVMTGIAGMHNQKNGFRSEEPMLIGNADMAQRVRLGGTTQPIIQMQIAGAALPSQGARKELAA